MRYPRRQMLASGAPDVEYTNWTSLEIVITAGTGLDLQIMKQWGILVGPENEGNWHPVVKHGRLNLKAISVAFAPKPIKMHGIRWLRLWDIVCKCLECMKSQQNTAVAIVEIGYGLAQRPLNGEEFQQTRRDAGAAPQGIEASKNGTNMIGFDRHQETALF